MDYKKSKAPVNTVTRNIMDLCNDTHNIYESVAIISKRANQISVEIKQDLSKKLAEFASYNDSLDEVFENREQIEISRYSLMATYTGTTQPPLTTRLPNNDTAQANHLSPVGGHCHDGVPVYASRQVHVWHYAARQCDVQLVAHSGRRKQELCGVESVRNRTYHHHCVYCRNIHLHEQALAGKVMCVQHSALHRLVCSVCRVYANIM